MNEISVEKQKLRKEYILIRKNVKDKENKSKIITQNVIENSNYRNAKIIALYKSLESEVDTSELIAHSIANGKIVALPKVVENELRFYKVDSVQETLVKSRFGVEEPIGDGEKYIDKSKIDLVIVPGLCFDRQKNRLGFGKSYYDRFLANTNLKKIAICFEEQIVTDRAVPATKEDIKMDQIITDKGEVTMATFDDFIKLDIRVGTIIEAKKFEKAKRPAYQLRIDLGNEIGIKKSSAQITEVYTADELIGKQVLAVVNFPSRQIADFMSEVLILGTYSKQGVVLIKPDVQVENGDKLG